METTAVMNVNNHLTAQNCTFSWKIINFNNRCKAVGEIIESPLFTVGDVVSDKIKWKLQLYPFGNENENKNYLSLYLICILSDDIDKCHVSYHCDFWNNREGSSHKGSLFSIKYTLFDKKNNESGYERFTFRYSEKLQSCISSSENSTLQIVCSICSINPSYTGGLIHCVELIRGFDSFFLSENLSDVTIEVDNKNFKAHKLVLSARSEVFSAMFNHDSIENNESVIKIADISYEVMKEVLRFIYCGKVENLDLHKIGLLAAANKYNLTSLKNCCEEAFWKNFSTDNICEILSIADLYQCNKLKTGAIQFIIKSLERAFKTSEFFELIDSNPNLLIDFFCNASCIKKS